MEEQQAVGEWVCCRISAQGKHLLVNRLHMICAWLDKGFCQQQQFLLHVCVAG
jgi:hypothetical protein